MTTPAKRKPAPAKSNVVKLPRNRKSRLTEADRAMIGTLAGALRPDQVADPAPAVRPLMDIASTQRVELERQGREALDEIAMIDATEAKAEEAHKALIASFDTAREEAIKRIEKAHANNVAVATGNRDAEREGRTALRSEYVEIAARCHAALTVDEAGIAAYRDGLTGGAEGQ